MKQWVRLIAGPHDGQVEKVDHDQNNVVRRKSSPPPATRAFNSHFGIEPSTVTIETTMYTRRRLQCGDKQIHYFAPENMSDFDALESVLGP